MKNTFTTEQDAIDAQEIDSQMYLAHHRNTDFNQAWEDNTTCWDEVRKREDAEEWFYEVCPVGVQTHTQKESEPSWFPEVEEI